MRYSILFSLVLGLGFSLSLSAQEAVKISHQGLRLEIAGGLTSAPDALRAEGKSSFRIGLDYNRKMSANVSLVGGFGIQHRNQAFFTEDGIPCVFPLGIKVITFVETESFELAQTELTAKVGIVYRWKRFELGLAAMPAYRISNEITYNNLTDFSDPNRPNNVFSTTFKAGDPLSFPSPTELLGTYDYSSDFNLQADISIRYAVTERWRVGASYRTMVSDYGLNAIRQFGPWPEGEQFSAKTNTVEVGLQYAF